MKKYVAIVAVFAALAFRAFAANEDVVVWEKIYNDLSTDDQRVAVMLRIMDFKNRDFTPMLVKALERVVGVQATAGSNTERYNRNVLARLLVRELGNLKSPESAELVFRVYSEYADPVIKSEAATALGKIRATDYAERLARDLESLNLGPIPSQSRGQEIVALGLVQGLGMMRAEVGYEPVFLAASGWYSQFSRVKETAKKVLPTLVDDPSESVTRIITVNPSVEIKTQALESLMQSRAPQDKKKAVSAMALKLALERDAMDAPGKAALSRMRVTSMNALTGLKDASSETVPLLVRVVGLDRKNDATLDETLKAYVALGVNGTDEAARFLAESLSGFSEREKSKANTARDKTLVRQIIASMVLSKNPRVKSALVQAQYADYDGGIMSLVRDALEKIPD